MGAELRWLYQGRVAGNVLKMEAHRGWRLSMSTSRGPQVPLAARNIEIQSDHHRKQIVHTILGKPSLE